MLVSKSRRFCFVHIQKTAGTSITADLQHQVDDARFKGASPHLSARQSRRKLGRRRWDAYFTFAFVRNPWERLLSWYTMIVAAPESRLKLYTYVHRNSSTFGEFILNCTDTIRERGAVKSFTTNQLESLCDESGEVIVDFIGRFEHLERDFAIVAARLGLERKPLPHIRHRSKHGHYSHHYTDETRDVVAARFARDIDVFGYAFDDRREG